MTLRFTRQSMGDIHAIDRYLADKSQQGLANVLASLKKSFRLIEANPQTGFPFIRDGVRIFIEPRNKYVIPCCSREDTVWILRICHSRRAPLDFLKLDLP